MGIEKMSFGEAYEEASLMQEKIKNKEALNYNEAEKVVEKEKVDKYFESIQSVSIPEGSNPRSPEKIIITDKCRRRLVGFASVGEGVSHRVPSERGAACIQ